MGKIYRATMRAFGAKPNGTGHTSCVDDAIHVKQIIMLLSLAFTFGALTFGYRGLPNRVRAVEDKVIRIESISTSIDNRLANIEKAIITNGVKK